MKIINVSVCKGENEIPQATDGAIFEQTITGITRKELYFEILNRLTVDYKMKPGDVIKLYVTELTMELHAIITICRRMGIKIICYFYHKDTGEYISQKIISYHYDKNAGEYIPQIM